MLELELVVERQTTVPASFRDTCCTNTVSNNVLCGPHGDAGNLGQFERHAILRQR